jgi:hypothetical protein
METSTIKTKVNEILTQTGLDFRIEKAPMVCINSLGEQIESPYFGLINSKSKQVINTVKQGYSVSQNDEVVELVLRGMEKFGDALKVQKGGALNGGGKVYLQLAIEGNSLVGNDTIKRYVTVIDSNDGSTSLSIGIGDLTMSCQNQFFKFYKKGNAKFRHTASMQAKLNEIPFLIETALNESLRQIEIYNRFVSTDVSRDLAHKLVKAILGYDKVYTSISDMSTKSTASINIMDKVYNHIEKETNQKGFNVWGLHSGITSYTTHEISTPKRDNARIESMLIGSAYKMNQESLAFAMRESGILELA